MMETRGQSNEEDMLTFGGLRVSTIQTQTSRSGSRGFLSCTHYGQGVRLK